jgi:hypothetical protein
MPNGAPSKASENCRSLSRSAASIRLRSLMSVAIPAVAYDSPCASRIANYSDT